MLINIGLLRTLVKYYFVLHPNCTNFHRKNVTSQIKSRFIYRKLSTTSFGLHNMGLFDLSHKPYFIN